MAIRWNIYFLILGLQLAAFVLSHSSSQSPQRSPQSLRAQAPMAETYYYVNGTEGCPKQIEWSPSCGGFILSAPNESTPQRFCNINKGPRVTQEILDQGRKKVLTTVTHNENLIRKSETVVYSQKENSISYQIEDTVIVDDTGKFLWEHSQNRKGFSCLYSR